jgi:hypothetical protein
MSPVTTIMIPVAVFLATRLLDIAVKARLAYWQQRLAEANAERNVLDSQSFDSSLKWAYVRGYADARHGLDIQVGAEVVVIEHRTQFPSTSP